MKFFGKTNLLKRALISGLILFIIFPNVVSANSSWHWVTISPMKALPLAIIFTLFVETLGIIKFGKITHRLRAFLVIVFANITSFIAPYIYSMLRLARFYGTGWDYSWERAFNNGPNYIIRFAYFLLTLCIEIPLVYFLLKKDSKNKNYLVFSILIVNIATTLMVAILERLFCRGQW